jgi:sRNA-binding regulator protein Hfq
MINNHTRLLLLAGALTISALTSEAQQRPSGSRRSQQYWDVLYLKNGSVIRGNIIDSNAATITLENRIQDTLVYAAQEVERTGRTPRPLKVSAQGFYGTMEAGIQFNETQGAVLRAIAGYRFGWQWQMGVGIGLDDYTVRSAPVFCDIRYDFSRKDKTLFMYGGAGAVIPWPTKTQREGGTDPSKKIPGFYLHTGLGYKIRLEHNHSMHISAGYAHSEMSLRYPAGWPSYFTYNYSYNRVTILLGYSF